MSSILFSTSTLEILQNVFISSFLDPIVPESLQMVIPLAVIKSIGTNVPNPPNCINIVDTGGNEYNVTVRGPTDDFADRVCDTIKEIIALDLNSHGKKILNPAQLGDIYKQPSLQGAEQSSGRDKESTNEVHANILGLNPMKITAKSSTVKVDEICEVVGVAASEKPDSKSTATGDVGILPKSRTVNATSIAAKLAALRESKK